MIKHSKTFASFRERGIFLYACDDTWLGRERLGALTPAQKPIMGVKGAVGTE
jgi:hypothetical protein